MSQRRARAEGPQRGTSVCGQHSHGGWPGGGHELGLSLSHQLPQDVCSAVSVRDPLYSILTNEQFIIRTPGDSQTSVTELGLGSGSRCVWFHLEGTCDSCGAHGRCCLRRSQENTTGPPWFWAQFLHWLWLATRWRQTSEDGHGPYPIPQRYPILPNTRPRVPQRGHGTSVCPQSRNAADTAWLQGRAHAGCRPGEAEQLRRQQKPTAQVGGHLSPFGTQGRWTAGF